MLWQHRGEGRVSAIALGRYLKLVDPAVAAQTDTPLFSQRHKNVNFIEDSANGESAEIRNWEPSVPGSCPGA